MKRTTIVFWGMILVSIGRRRRVESVLMGLSSISHQDFEEKNRIENGGGEHVCTYRFPGSFGAFSLCFAADLNSSIDC